MLSGKAMMKKTPSTLDDYIAAQGQGNDTLVAHLSPREAAILKAYGGSGAINPKTGMLEFDEEGGGGESAGGAGGAGDSAGGNGGGGTGGGAGEGAGMGGAGEGGVGAGDSSGEGGGSGRGISGWEQDLPGASPLAYWESRIGRPTTASQEAAALAYVNSDQYKNDYERSLITTNWGGSGEDIDPRAGIHPYVYGSRMEGPDYATYWRDGSVTRTPYEDKGTFGSNWIPALTQGVMSLINPWAGAAMSAMTAIPKLTRTGGQSGQISTGSSGAAADRVQVNSPYIRNRQTGVITRRT